MGEEPAAIREQIEETRERMGEAVDALGYKADVPSRARDSLSEKVQGVRARITGTGGQISQASPDAEDVKRAGRQAAGVVQENPLGLALGAVAVGFLAGMLVPSTRVEDEQVGSISDQVKEQARQSGQEALDRGRQVAQEAAETASQRAKQAASEVKEQVQETAQQQAEELKSSAQDSVREAKQRSSRGIQP